MAQQILIIGLGQFGMSLARTLSEKGAEVLAVDVKKSLVEEAAAFVTEAVIANAADETELARLEPGRRDSAVCAIGDDSREASIICTALLRQMGVPVIISRANDAVHQRILQLVGAHQIINPEHEFGKRFANRLLYKHVITDTNIGESLHLTEILVQPSMVGKTLVDLELPKRFGVLVVGIRRGLEGKIHQPSPVDPLLADDHLIIVSRESAIPKFIQGV
jgi:trk system potassium uptake protein TrkA